jgi:hypothetical protein
VALIGTPWRDTLPPMAEERLFSAISAYVAKHAHVELQNDLGAGTMTVVFKGHGPSDGQVVALKVYGTRNVEISVGGPPEWKNFRRIAQIYSHALDLLDVFHLIEVEHADGEPQSGKGGLRIARSSRT